MEAVHVSRSQLTSTAETPLVCFAAAVGKHPGWPQMAVKKAPSQQSGCIRLGRLCRRDGWAISQSVADLGNRIPFGWTTSGVTKRGGRVLVALKTHQRGSRAALERAVEINPEIRQILNQK